MRSVSQVSKINRGCFRRFSSELFSKDAITRTKGKRFHPETLSLGLGYHPEEAMYSVKPPVYLTSTYQFKSAEAGKAHFAKVFGLEGADGFDDDDGYVYSRLGNPDMNLWEQRLAAWDECDVSLAFASGMAAISTMSIGLTLPGDNIISTRPVYGGTDALFDKILPPFGVKIHWIEAGDAAVDQAHAITSELEAKGEKVRLIYAETPANPSNVHTDIEGLSQISRRCTERHPDRRCVLAVDNTFLGPVFQQPKLQGADLIVYSATKYLGGHSDLIAGAVSGPEDLIGEIHLFRTILGTISQPFVSWLLLRSLETLSIRMHAEAENAKKIAEVLESHPAVTKVDYPTLLAEDSNQKLIYDRQCLGPGSLITFHVDGGEEEAFKVLNALEVCRLAVSLGGTETLVEHPSSMTHADVPHGMLQKMGVTDSTIRMSVGIENVDDLKRDIVGALDKMALTK